MRGLFALLGVLALVAAFGAAACGGSDEEKTNTTGAVSLEQDDFYFQPTNLTGEVGKPLPVSLKNEGKTSHTFTIDSLNIDQVLKRSEDYTTLFRSRRGRACRGVWRGGLRRQRRGENEHDRSGLPRAGRLLFPADKPNRRGRQAAPGFPQKRREDLPHFHNRLVEHRPGPQAG